MNQNGSILDQYKAFETTVCDELTHVPHFDHPLRDINIFHTNVRSIYKNFENLLVFIESTEKKFDLIVLSETHTIYNIADFNIKGFKVFWNDGSVNKFDGCAMYVREEIYREHAIVEVNNVKCLNVSILKNNKKVDIMGLYRSPSTNSQNFIGDLNDILSENTKDQKRIYVLAGDININLLETNSGVVNDYLTVLSSHGFHSLINKPTRVQAESATCIDHFFVKYKENMLKSINPVVLTRTLTDHYPIILNIELSVNGNGVVTENQFLKKTNYKLLNELLSRAGWNDVLNCNDVDICTELFVGRLKGYISGATSVYKINNKNRRLKPWITSGLLTSIRNRDQLKKCCTMHPDNIEALNRYKQYRTSLSKLIKKTKYEYYKTKLEQNTRDARKVWRVIREVTGDQAGVTNIRSIASNNMEFTNRAEIANEFNNHFSTIGKKLAKDIKPIYSGRQRRSIVPLSNQNSFYFTPITENELILQINTLKNNVKCGDDDITSEMIKNNHRFLLGPLAHIINLVFSKGIFPRILKKAIIVPLFKQGDRKLTTNYRPIALISTISKLIEKCIKSKLSDFLKRFNLLSVHQYAFREGSNTENALCKVTGEILKNLDAGRKVIAIFLDLAKAFDTVEHRILLERLYKIGVRGIAYNLFKSYLHERTQRVKIENVLSDSLEVDTGVPQGTVLGPLLFNIYINGVLTELDEGRVFCFADDTALIINDVTWDLVIEKSEIAITKLKNWLDSSYLSLNLSKTKFVAFGLSKKALTHTQTLKIHDPDCKVTTKNCKCKNTIGRALCLKYLGILIDEGLTWKNHVDYVSQRLRKLIYKFYELRSILRLKDLKMVYCSLVESVVAYGIVAWGNACGNAMSALIVAQKYLIKVMLFKNKRYPTVSLFQEGELLTVEQLHIKSVIRFMIKVPYYKVNIDHNLNTRNAVSQNVQLPSVSLSAAQRHISFTGPKLYNALPLRFKVKPYKLVKHIINEWILGNSVLLSALL